MTLSEIRDLFAFNAWANRKILDGAAGLPVDEYVRDLKSSHGGVHGTLCHIVWGEELWLARWMDAPPPAVGQGRDLPSLDAARRRWEEVAGKQAAFLAAFTDARLAETRVIHPTTGGAYVHTFAEMFLHVVDHSSYHRGQVVTLIRQLGHGPPVTNLIYYYRERGPAPR